MMEDLDTMTPGEIAERVVEIEAKHAKAVDFILDQWADELELLDKALADIL
jgi:hypothetical protein